MDTHAPAGPTEGAAARTPLTRDRVMQGALDLADTIGVETFTMRRLATALDVKPMTIYHYVAGKEQIIDGIVDLVFAQIRLPRRMCPGSRPCASAAIRPARSSRATRGPRP